MKLIKNTKQNNKEVGSMSVSDIFKQLARRRQNKQDNALTKNQNVQSPRYRLDDNLQQTRGKSSSFNKQYLFGEKQQKPNIVKIYFDAFKNSKNSKKGKFFETRVFTANYRTKDMDKQQINSYYQKYKVQFNDQKKEKQNEINLIKTRLKRRNQYKKPSLFQISQQNMKYFQEKAVTQRNSQSKRKIATAAKSRLSTAKQKIRAFSFDQFQNQSENMLQQFPEEKITDLEINRKYSKKQSNRYVEQLQINPEDVEFNMQFSQVLKAPKNISRDRFMNNKSSKYRIQNFRAKQGLSKSARSHPICQIYESTVQQLLQQKKGNNLEQYIKMIKPFGDMNEIDF